MAAYVLNSRIKTKKNKKINKSVTHSIITFPRRTYFRRGNNGDSATECTTYTAIQKK